jgi:RHS repeat-associated protein
MEAFLALTRNIGPNGDQTTVLYDSYARPSSTTSPTGAVTTYAYTMSPPTVTATTNGRWTKKTLDGFGRIIREEAGNGSTIVSVVETEYDSCACSPIGKLKRVSMPHAPNAAVYWTTYNYDGLGRTVSVTSPDGASTKRYEYAGNTVKFIDEAGRWKKYTMDAFGNIVQVEEPKPAADTVHAGNYFTYYSYDVLNHLIQVRMPRRDVTQTRSFYYGNPPGAHLLSATNPENGTVTYSYDANHRLSSRIDAKNQKTAYSYDGYGRLTQIRHYPASSGAEDVCQQVNIGYDTNAIDSTYSQNALGRMTTRTYKGVNCNTAPYTFTEMYSYSVAGQVTKKRLRIARQVVQAYPYPTVTVSADLNSAYTYDIEGRMRSITYPTASPDMWEHTGGATYSYEYDAMGRLWKMSSGSFLTEATYGPAGELLTLSRTSTAPYLQSESRAYNSRLQLTRVGTHQYEYSPTQNNGRIVSETDSSTGEQIVYAYDELNRLITAVTADNLNVTQWGQRFTYDGFGNLTDKDVMKGSAPVWHGLVDPATNRVNINMDANGNQLRAFSGEWFSYDAENRLKSVTAYGVASAYGYDPDNRRIYRSFAGGRQEITFWSPAGQMIGVYELKVDEKGNQPYYGPSMTLVWKSEWYYFGSRRLNGAQDRLASWGKYYPYGEERGTATANDGHKFATYFRDADTGLDYAVNRYYDAARGRFLTPDPYRASGGPADPGSWNRYAYVQGDPINAYDPQGLMWVLIRAGADGLTAPGSAR